MSFLNKEKTIYAIQTFLMFLNITKETQKHNVLNFEHYIEEVLSLLEKVSAQEIDPLSAALSLNKIIENTNQLLKAPYPVIATDTSVNLVKGEIVAFEHYLNQELKANHLSIQEEAPLFNDSLILWEKVGSSLTAKEGASEFCVLVKKLNTLLPKEKHYPLPDENDY